MIENHKLSRPEKELSDDKDESNAKKERKKGTRV